MTNKEVIEMFREDIFPMQAERLSRLNFEGKGELDKTEYLRDAAILLELAEKGLEADWIPIKTRPLSEEEKTDIDAEYEYMYDCPLPDDDEEVIVTDCYGNVEVDTFCRDVEGCYFENNCDDGEVVAWMPLPKPYKTEGSEGNA